MSTRPLPFDPHLQQAVDCAREAIAVRDRLRPTAGRYRSHLDEQERAAVAKLIGDGTYRRLADALAAEDPEIADQ